MKKLVRDVSGVLLLDKEQDISSNGVLQRVKHMFSAKKAGHTGTLDPFATGLLVICLGEANKYSRWLLDADKSYEFSISLGSQTDTADNTGEVIASKPNVNFSQNELDSVASSFIGLINQIPPNYSALKVNGKRAYEMARNGEEFELKSRQVQIYSLELTKISDSKIIGKATVSKGTYIRVLVEDIAKKLGMLGHCDSLRRSSFSTFEPYLANMINFSDLQYIANPNMDIAKYGTGCFINHSNNNFSELDRLLLPTDILCQSFEKINISQQEWIDLTQGKFCVMTDLFLNRNKIIMDNVNVGIYRGYLNDIQNTHEQFVGLVEITFVDDDFILRAFRMMAC